MGVELRQVTFTGAGSQAWAQAGKSSCWEEIGLVGARAGMSWAGSGALLELRLVLGLGEARAWKGGGCGFEELGRGDVGLGMGEANLLG